jgi:predicted amidophosphoribosyltransferase
MAAKTFDLWFQNCHDGPEDERESCGCAWRAAIDSVKVCENSAQQLKQAIALVRACAKEYPSTEDYRAFLDYLIYIEQRACV